MSLAIEWNGKTYDIDPGELEQEELKAIQQRTGYSYLQLAGNLALLDSDAVTAMFWVIDRRDDPALKFGEYKAPKPAVLMAHADAIAAWSTEVLGKVESLVNAVPGSGGSQSSTATRRPSSTA